VNCSGLFPFDNGNKRTAVIALDLFLAANGQFLYLDNDRMYQLAMDTASYVPKGIPHQEMLARIASEVRDNTMPIAKMEDGGFQSLVRSARTVKRRVRNHPYNKAAQGQFFLVTA
jgi:hypothetical protein